MEKTKKSHKRLRSAKELNRVVAEFYLDLDRPEAAIGRLEAAHRRYPGVGLLTVADDRTGC